MKGDGSDKKSTGLIIWIDMKKVLEDVATK
jgi:hypothetical protein